MEKQEAIEIPSSISSSSNKDIGIPYPLVLIQYLKHKSDRTILIQLRIQGMMLFKLAIYTPYEYTIQEWEKFVDRLKNKSEFIMRFPGIKNSCLEISAFYGDFICSSISDDQGDFGGSIHFGYKINESIIEQFENLITEMKKDKLEEVD